MTEKTNGKRNALLGGLVVFMVPILAVSLVYFSASRLPKSKELPMLQKSEAIGSFQFLNTQDTISNGSHWQDVKLLFPVNSNNINARVNSMGKFLDFAEKQPAFTIKDPYPQVYLIALTDDITYQGEISHPNLKVLSPKESLPVFKDQDAIYLLDGADNLRGQYYFSEDDLQLLFKDMQYLMQDQFYANADSLKIKRMFKTELDE